MKNSCNSCKDDRPDILRSNIHVDVCGEDCCDCTDNCPPSEPCDCPLGHMAGTCVHYTGCKTFIGQFTPGMTFDQIVSQIEEVFTLIDKKMSDYCDTISALEERIEELEKKDSYGKKCDEWEEPVGV